MLFVLKIAKELDKIVDAYTSFKISYNIKVYLKIPNNFTKYQV